MNPQEVEIPHKRVLARKLLHQGQEYSLALIQISDDRRSIQVTPFEAETAGTVFVSAPVRSYQSEDGLWHLSCPSAASL